jgi:ABC-2 type transport system permease protein
MPNFIKKIKPIVKKEFRQIKRDPRTIFLLVIFPAFLLIVLGFAINFDVKNVSTLIVDEDKTSDSRKLVEQFNHNEYFRLYNVISDRNQIDDLLNRGFIKAAIIIPNGFSKDLLKNKSVSIAVIIDGSDSNIGGAVVNYIAQIFYNYSEKIIIEASKKVGVKILQPIDIKSRVWFNEDLKTVRFLIPGLVAFILLVVSSISTTLSIVREKEKGNMEQLYVSPISAFEIIVGKIVSYFVFAIIAATLVFIFSYFIFDITIKGNIFSLYFVIILFVVGALGMGILISSISESTQVAFMMVAFVTLLPTFLLSDFIFPVKNMPIVLQIISYIVPAKYFIIALRAIILKGVGIYAFWSELLCLISFSVLMFTVSTYKFIKGKVQ